MPEAETAVHTRTLHLPAVGTKGTVSLPEAAQGIVPFAHGSGSSRFSPRNAYVASALQEVGLATFLFDLLTDEEAEDRAKVFDIPLLAERLLLASDTVHQDGEMRDLPVGYFGASTGAAAALVAAAQATFPIGAVVSRGGRPDLAGSTLPDVRAPTLLIVGGLDREVIALYRSAFVRLGCEKDLQIVPGATHLFEEPGTLDQVIVLARHWIAGISAAESRPDAAAIRR